MWLLVKKRSGKRHYSAPWALQPLVNKQIPGKLDLRQKYVCLHYFTQPNSNKMKDKNCLVMRQILVATLSSSGSYKQQSRELLSKSKDCFKKTIYLNAATNWIA